MRPPRPGAERLILVDAGNTATGVAVAEGGRLARVATVPTQGTTRAAVRAAVAKAAGRSAFDGAVLCSVVPRVDDCWMQALGRVVKGRVLQVSARLRLGLGIRYPKPETIGADRLANAAAAAVRYGAPVVVADFGTALTFDIVSAEREYVGGIIAPGLGLMLDYLHERTALLPRIRLAPVRRAIGKSTVEAMRIGATIGYRGMVLELMRELRADLAPARVRFCATGGLARAVVGTLGARMPVDPLLTYRGLKVIYNLNRGGR